MSKFEITLERDTALKGFFSTNTVGTDALNAMGAIPGVKDLEIVNESDHQVQLTYGWVGHERFQTIDEHLLKFGLRLVQQ